MGKYSEFWVCEGCGAVYSGANPPDMCQDCDHPYFENMQDLVDQADDADKSGSMH